MRFLDEISWLAQRQLTLDKAATKRFPKLLSRKHERMGASPLAFLRGSAPLFYEIIGRSKDLADGPRGEGWIVGDLHLENFGAYRPDVFADAKRGKTQEACFNLNDFDETCIGPWRFDVLRLMTSLLLGGRELGASGPEVLELADKFLEAWASALFDEKPLRSRCEAPAPVEALLEQVRHRTRTKLLDARTEVTRGKRRFVRGSRYAELSKDIRSALPRVFDRYIASLPDSDSPKKGSLEILDAAHRIAGTGSLGVLRIGVLVEGKGGPDGAWIFDLKEQRDPSAGALVRRTDDEPAVRVVEGFRACIEHPPRVMGTTRLAELSLFGRRLAPQEDKLVLPSLRSADLPSLATYLGGLVGSAHRRGATKPSSRWSKSDRETIRTQAIALAGLHEAIYLAYCERIR